ncbi:hypothetical protein ACWDA7_39945 [Streptomyces sp. NPDC001156]
MNGAQPGRQPGLRRPLILVVAFLAAATAAGIQACRQSEQDARTRERFVQLNNDPLMDTLRTQFGRQHDGKVRLRCQHTPGEGPLIPQFEVTIPAVAASQAVRDQVATAARRAGKRVETWERGTGGPRVYYFEIRKSFGRWTSDSDATLDGAGLHLDLMAFAGDRCA